MRLFSKPISKIKYLVVNERGLILAKCYSLAEAEREKRRIGGQIMRQDSLF
jgi:hypothetical protein